MADRVFQRAYRAAMGQLLKPLGFTRKGSTWWKLSQGVLQCIGLNRNESGAFTADTWVQPLLYRAEHFILTFGGRLHRLSPDIPVRWDVPDTDQMDLALEEYCSAIQRYALPRLSQIDSYSAFVNTEKAKKWPFLIVQNRSKFGMVGCCALAVQEYEYGNSLLEQNRDYLLGVADNFVKNYNMPPPEWANAELTVVQNLLTLSQQAKYDKLRIALRENEEYTIKHLGLDASPSITV